MTSESFFWRLTLTTMIGWLCFTSCRNDEIQLPDIPVLKADKLQTFNVGDQFMLIESSNSCCLYLWSNGRNTSEVMPITTVAKATDVIHSPADPDCAGCSSFSYHIMTCVKQGIDTFYHFTIPAGSSYIQEEGDTTNEDGIDLNNYEDAIKTMYIIQVK